MLLGDPKNIKDNKSVWESFSYLRVVEILRENLK